MTWPPWRIRIWCTKEDSCVYIFWPQSHGKMRNFGICSSKNCFSRNIKLELSSMRTENMRVNHKIDLIGLLFVIPNS